MKQDKEEWVVSLDGENYNGYITYPTKESAIETGQKEFTNVKNGQYSEVFDGYIGDDKFFIVYSGSPIRVTNSLLKCKVNKLDLLTTTNEQISEMQVYWKIELAEKISRKYKDCNVGDGARL